MANKIFANNREVSCKAANGKSVAAFPDVCFTPPQTPGTPPGIPIPYPNTGLATDTTSGSRSVRISGKEVMLKNKSYFKTSYGDEAGCAPKKGVMTSVNRGKVYFQSWSMDVKIEGENVVRMMDVTTHNHGSMPGNTPTWPYLDEVAAALPGCQADRAREQQACEGCKPYGKKDPCPDRSALSRAKKAHLATSEDSPERAAAWKIVQTEYEDLAQKTRGNACLQARRCQMVPYKSESYVDEKGKKGRQPKCCDGQTAHHVIEASAFLVPGTRDGGGVLRDEWVKAAKSKKTPSYDLDRAPCVCAEGPNNTTATHGQMHTVQGVRAKKLAPDGTWTLKEAAKTGAASINMVFSKGGLDSGDPAPCDAACLEAQLVAYHKSVGIEPEDKIVASPSGKLDGGEAAAANKAWKKYEERMQTQKTRSMEIL